MPYPSVADKLVASIFARDFQGSSTVAAANADDVEAIIAIAAASCNPTFDEVIDHTRRICVQACCQSIQLFLRLISVPAALHRLTAPTLGSLARRIHPPVQPAVSLSLPLAAATARARRRRRRRWHRVSMEWRVISARLGRRNFANPRFMRCSLFYRAIVNALNVRIFQSLECTPHRSSVTPLRLPAAAAVALLVAQQAAQLVTI